MSTGKCLECVCVGVFLLKSRKVHEAGITDLPQRLIEGGQAVVFQLGGVAFVVDLS